MTRLSKRELERAVDDLTDGVRATSPEVTEADRKAIRAALAWRYDNPDAVDADPNDTVAVLTEAVDHVEEPHATTLRDLLGREGTT